MKILRLNKAGDPLSWISKEHAAELYAKDQVVWELGENPVIMHGGHNSQGIQSRLSMATIIASDGRVCSNKFSVGLSNPALFRRDENRCMYCGEKFPDSMLTRDHVIPRGLGRNGPDVWENVVAACKRCNSAKGCRTPEEFGHLLLAVPFKPNPYEFMYLLNRKILGDQMEYLSTRFSNQRAWAA
jgi:hypothetical protein